MMVTLDLKTDTCPDCVKTDTSAQLVGIDVSRFISYGLGVSQSGVRLDMIIPAAVQVQYLAGQWRRSGVLLVLRLD